MRHQALWFRNRHSRYGLRGVRVGEASHPGPAGSRYFALTEVDSDAEDEDSNSHISEVCPPERSGRRRLVILGAQTQEDPVDPTALDEDLEVGSDHSPDTESTDTRGGTSDAAGEAEVVSVPEAPVPTVSVPVERFTDSFQWLGEVDLEVVFKRRPCLMKSVPGFMKGAYRSAMRVACAEINQGRVERCNSVIMGLEVVPLAPSSVVAQAPERRFGAQEEVAGQIRGVC